MHLFSYSLSYSPIRIGSNRCLTITKKDCKRQLVTWLPLSSDSLSVLNDLVQRFPTSSNCVDLQSSEQLEPGQSALALRSPVIQCDFVDSLLLQLKNIFNNLLKEDWFSTLANSHFFESFQAVHLMFVCSYYNLANDASFFLDISVDKNKRSWLLHNSIPTVPQRRTLSLLDSVRRSLPVFDHQGEILQLLKENRVLLVLGDTGSGKSTQVGV